MTAGATLADTAGVTVGLTGTGTVAVTGGARISSAGLDEIGAAGGQSGTATVAGLGSVWNTTGRFVVGAAGQGMLSVATGGTVSAQQLELGAQAGGIGTVAVDGVGSQVSVTGSLVAVGEAGKGALALTNGGVALRRSHSPRPRPATRASPPGA